MEKIYSRKGQACRRSGPFFFVYIVRCTDGTLYTGTARNVSQRIKRHNEGKGAKYTRAFGPVKLLWSKRYKNRSKACQVESEIKSWSRKQKLEWIREKV